MESDELVVPLTDSSPGGLHEDAVVLSYLKQSSHEAEYKSKLSSLYTNELLQSVQFGIISMFQKNKLPGKTQIELNHTTRSLLKLDIGDFIVPFYEERILKKGMWILREDMKDYDGENLLVAIADTWNYFFKELLPSLQVILFDVKAYKNQTVKERTLLSFRDEMLLKTDIETSMKHLVVKDPQEDMVAAAFQQMFLILLGVYDSTQNYQRLEALAAQLLAPLITARGVYYNGKVDLAVKADDNAKLKKSKSAGNLISSRATFTLPRMVAPKHTRQKSQPVIFIKELLSGSISNTEPRLSTSRLRAQSQSDIL